MTDWNNLIRTKTLTYQRKQPDCEFLADIVEKHIAQQNWHQAETALYRYKGADSSQSNPVVKEIRWKIYEAQIQIGQRRLVSSLPDTLHHVADLARQNGFKKFELEANLELAKFWMFSDQSQLAGRHLCHLDDQVEIVFTFFS